MTETSFQSIDHLFRRAYGNLVAQFTARYSTQYIDLIEDAVQEALIKAMRTWPFAGGEPQNPEGWLYRVANNYIIDQIRRGQKAIRFDSQESGQGLTGSASEPGGPSSRSEGLASGPGRSASGSTYSYGIGGEIDAAFDPKLEGELEDEQLKMVFACCHPALQEKERLMLSLKLLGGLGTREIAAALFKKPEAIKKAITRAKDKFKDKIGHLEVPIGVGLKSRLSSVLRVIYLMYNEGYKASEGELLIKREVCDEAIRLALILAKHPNCNTPELNALLALMYFNSSRFDARIGPNGEIITLEHQDRALWSKEMIAQGKYFFSRATQGDERSEYHFLAGIAAFYTTAESFEQTNWESILLLYDWLLHYAPNPMAALNRIVVVEKVKGAEQAIKELNGISGLEQVKSHYLFHAIHADLLIVTGQMAAAALALESGVNKASNTMEKRFMRKKLGLIREHGIQNQ